VYPPTHRADGSRHEASSTANRVVARIAPPASIYKRIFDAGVDLFFRLTLQCIGEDCTFLSFAVAILGNE